MKNIWCLVFGHKFPEKSNKQLIDKESGYKKKYITFVYKCKRNNCERKDHKSVEHGY